MTITDQQATVAADAWLTEVMRTPVFRVQVDCVADELTVADSVRRHAATQTAAMYYAKVPTDRLRQVHALEKVGFSVIEVAVRLTLEESPPGIASPGLVVADFKSDHAGPVLDIAGACFRYSRFHTDPRVPLSVAHHVKREWIRSYVEGRRGVRLLVAVLDGRVAGFLAVLATESAGVRVLTIDLVGVADWAQRRGVGRALVQNFVDLYCVGSARLQVGTQIVNMPSLRLYHHCGFVLSGSHYVLHLHIGSLPRGPEA